MRIVDLHTFKGDCLYVGRQMGRRPGSPLGNPFKPAAGEPVGTCLGRYRAWLFSHIRNRDTAVLAALAAVTDDAVLGCWCTSLTGEAVFAEPEVCHAQVVAKAARWVREQRIELPAPSRTVKALSVAQPYAWAIVHGPKRVENRTWTTPYRGPLAIHASKSKQFLAGPGEPLNDGTPEPAPADMAFGALIGTATLIDVCRPGDRRPDPRVAEAMASPWADGPFCWVLADVRPLPEPIPYRGGLGLMEVPADVLAGVPA